MDPRLYKAVQEGNLNVMREKKELISTTQLTPNKNTLLHVAAQVQNHSSKECASEILKTNESLLYEVNSDGETALHVAARTGNVDVGEQMMRFARSLDEDLEEGGRGGALKKLLSWRNRNGDTALHEATRNNRPLMVKLMIREDPEIANIANNAMETPLFLAAVSNPAGKYRSTKCLDYIMEYCPLPAYGGPNGKTALHAVALYNWKGISEKLLNKHPTIIREVDDRGWSALHYAAVRGSNEVAVELLKADKSIAYIVAEKDYNKTALHIATSQGNVKIMEKILAYFPDCWEMVTGNGQNILHLSAESQQVLAWRFIMEKSWAGNLINQKDEEGNTPLHVCAAAPEFLTDYDSFRLANHPQVDKNAVNKENMTPLGVIMFSNVYSIPKNTLRRRLEAEGAEMDAWNLTISEKSLLSQTDKHYVQKEVAIGARKMADTHILVAALITTVAFAAGFTIPGGYDGNDGPNEGLAVLSRKTAFKVFVITDTLAMVCSASAVFLHFFAAIYMDGLLQSRRYFVAGGSTYPAEPSIPRLLESYYYAAMLVIVAMFAMVIAFMSGLYTVLEHSRELAIIECVISSLFFPAIHYVLPRVEAFINWVPPLGVVTTSVIHDILARNKTPSWGDVNA